MANINERQFRNIYKKALKKGDTNENLIGLEIKILMHIYREDLKQQFFLQEISFFIWFMKHLVKNEIYANYI